MTPTIEVELDDNQMYVCSYGGAEICKARTLAKALKKFSDWSKGQGL